MRLIRRATIQGPTEEGKRMAKIEPNEVASPAVLARIVEGRFDDLEDLLKRMDQ